MLRIFKSWANRFDRELTDIFAVQDELTSEIVARAQGQKRNPAGPAVSAGQSDTQTFLIWSTAVTSNSSIMPRI